MESIHLYLLVNQKVAKTIFPLQQVCQESGLPIQRVPTSKSLCAAKKVLISQHSAWTEGKFTSRTSCKTHHHFNSPSFCWMLPFAQKKGTIFGLNRGGGEPDLEDETFQLFPNLQCDPIPGAPGLWVLAFLQPKVHQSQGRSRIPENTIVQWQRSINIEIMKKVEWQHLHQQLAWKQYMKIWHISNFITIQEAAHVCQPRNCALVANLLSNAAEVLPR